MMKLPVNSREALFLSNIVQVSFVIGANMGRASHSRCAAAAPESCERRYSCLPMRMRKTL